MHMKASTQTIYTTLTAPEVHSTFGYTCQYWGIHGADLLKDIASVIIYKPYHTGNYKFHIVPTTRMTKNCLQALSGGLFEDIYLPIDPVYYTSGPIEPKHNFAVFFMFNKQISSDLVQVDLYDRLAHTTASWYLDLSKLPGAKQIWLAQLTHDYDPIAAEQAAGGILERALSSMTGDALDFLATAAPNAPFIHPQLMDNMLKHDIIELTSLIL